MAVAGGRRQQNSAVVIRLLHAAINEAVGMDNNTRGEWTREQFRSWAHRISEKYSYTADFYPVGAEDAEFGAPTQMAVFTK